MISLAGEFTDGKGRHAKGWLFFDAECSFCIRIARWLAPRLERRGFGVAPLQDPRVGPLLGMSRHELLRELRFLHPDGSQSGGSDAVLAVAAILPWARPLNWAARIPLLRRQMDAGYRWVSAQRSCHAVDGTCRVDSSLFCSEKGN